LVCRLREIYPPQQISYSEEQNDPPDFWISVAEEKYAIEVTSIVLDQDYHARCMGLLNSIRSALPAGCLRGTYGLVIDERPEIPRKGTVVWENLIATVISHIRGISDSPPLTERCLQVDAHGRLEVVKVANDGASIGLIGPVTAKGQGEVLYDLQQLMNEAVASKRKKIEKKGILDSCPNVILVFYDAYGFGRIEKAKQALLHVDGYEWFHSIFWAASFNDRPNSLFPDSPGRKGEFLYSKKVEWFR
jgi:hypothetical protein